MRNPFLYSWSTEHDHVKGVMTHSFDNEIKCVMDWNKRTVTLVNKAETVDVFPVKGTGYTINSHVSLLVHVAAIAREDYICGNLLKTRTRKLKKLRHVLSM
jgi:hypothetical protein